MKPTGRLRPLNCSTAWPLSSIAQAGEQLAHQLADGYVSEGIAGFACWAWINFSWLASSFDINDWLYRVMTMVQMVGVVVMARGLPAMFHSLQTGVISISASWPQDTSSCVWPWLRSGSGQSHAARLAGRLRWPMGRPYKMTPVKLRLAMASIGQPGTKASDLCTELGITRQTLYRHGSPTGELRPDGEMLFSR
jgi:hypothetical protein